MVVFSALRQTAPQSLRALARTCRLSQTLVPAKSTQLVLQRGMAGHKRTMPIIPGRLIWDTWKDQVHKYFMIGLIPMGALIFYTNVFIGQAELADIPEDYEPKPWEYHQHPIKRWFARYVYEAPEKTYEKFMHVIYVEDEKRKMRLQEWKIKDLMGTRQDYKGWYWIPLDARRYERAVEGKEDWESTYGRN